MLPILDFFYGIVPSYGLAIIFLTLVIRFALYPLNAGTIRNMRKMKVVQPILQKRMRELQERYANDPEKMRTAQTKLYSDLGVSPLGGCLPLFVQMPVLFALFATLRGSPFANVPFDMTIQILPSDVAAEVAPAPFSSASKNLFLTDKIHKPVLLTAPTGNKIGVGAKVKLLLQSAEGQDLAALEEEIGADPGKLTPVWSVTKGAERVQLQEDGTILALEPGEVTVQASIPGLASDTGFLFIDKLGQVGAVDPDGTIHWDIIAMIVVFGLSIYVNQSLSGQSGSSDSQSPINKITPLIFSGMFLFFPLPAGVLLYILVSNIFQTGQTYILSLEPLPPNIQSLVEQQTPESSPQTINVSAKEERDTLPFEN
ncbi:MAG: membrane protein insertase YidC [Synechococcales cyanobacterium]